MSTREQNGVFSVACKNLNLAISNVKYVKVIASYDCYRECAHIAFFRRVAKSAFLRSGIKQCINFFDNGFGAGFNRPLFGRYVEQLNKLAGSKIASNLAYRATAYTVSNHKNTTLIKLIRRYMVGVGILVYFFNARC